jgi:putative oxidoreductase
MHLALLLLRATTGALLAGHGAQKLFGAFGGHGPDGTGAYFESLGMRPGRTWAQVAGASELGGGALLALGALSPLGPLAVMGVMAMAALRGHGGKPIWATAGGAELPVTNLAIAAALALAGPGRYSVDALLGVRVPPAVTALAAGAGVVVGLATGGGRRAEEVAPAEASTVAA